MTVKQYQQSYYKNLQFLKSTIKQLKTLLFIALFSILFTSNLYAKSPHFLVASPKKSEGMYAFLRRYMLDKSSCNIRKFLSLNKTKKNVALLHKRRYKLPIYVYKFNGKSIRATIKGSDYKRALKIKTYNDNLRKRKLRKSYAKQKNLWVAYSDLYCYGSPLKPQKINLKKFKTKKFSFKKAKYNINLIRKKAIALFGKKYRRVRAIDHVLRDHVYYIVSGHGGPDPGARYIGKKYILCEDEYAYDVSLRLAKTLITHGATVYIMIQDKNDGIRNAKYLACDKDETSFYNKQLPLKQRRRLKQRTDEINSLYKKHKKWKAKSQVMVSIHVDSRAHHKRQDTFFYHFRRSWASKQLALSLQKIFTQKYQKYRKNRIYQGTVSTRKLYILENAQPTSVFIELGNIQNINNQKRLMSVNHRQALAKWIYLGLKKMKK